MVSFWILFADFGSFWYVLVQIVVFVKNGFSLLSSCGLFLLVLGRFWFCFCQFGPHQPFSLVYFVSFCLVLGRVGSLWNSFWISFASFWLVLVQFCSFCFRSFSSCFRLIWLKNGLSKIAFLLLTKWSKVFFTYIKHPTVVTKKVVKSKLWLLPLHYW